MLKTVFSALAVTALVASVAGGAFAADLASPAPASAVAQPASASTPAAAKPATSTVTKVGHHAGKQSVTKVTPAKTTAPDVTAPSTAK